MKVIVDIPNWLYNAMMECKEPQYSRSLGDAVRDGTPLPKNTTNGDVIKALFGRPAREEKTGVLYKFKYRNGKPMFSTYFDMDWWNAPYKAEK